MVSVGIIEDDWALRRNIEDCIGLERDVFLSFSVNSMEAFLEGSDTYNEPYLVLIDLGLPGISGLEGIVYVRKKWPEAHIVVVTGNDDENVIFECIQRGANGYLLKPFQVRDLLKNIDVIRNGGALITPEVALKLFNKIHRPSAGFAGSEFGLTGRENEVVEELLKGLSYKEVSNVLGISSSTVNDHVKNIYIKMGVRSKSELIAKALKK